MIAAANDTATVFTPAANDATAQVALASVRITHAGASAAFPSFEAADAVVRALASSGARTTVSFLVTWVDSTTWEGRIDVQPPCQFKRAIVGQHMRYLAESSTGRRRLPGYSVDEQVRLAVEVGVTPEVHAFRSRILDHYDLGPVVTPAEEAAALSILGAWRLAENERKALESQAALEKTWWTGEKYDGSLRPGDISRLLRADLNAIAKASPSVLFGCSFTLKSTGRAVYVSVKARAGAPVVGLARARIEATNPNAWPLADRLSNLGKAMLAVATAAGNAYNYDRSDRGRGHDENRKHFMLSVDFDGPVISTAWDEVKEVIERLKTLAPQVQG